MVVSFSGPGIDVGDGLTVITNAHVVSRALKAESDKILGILAYEGEASEFRPTTIIAVGEEYGMVRQCIGGCPLPVLELGDSSEVVKYQAVTFTGFPSAIGLEFHHATDRGGVASITSVVNPLWIRKS